MMVRMNPYPEGEDPDQPLTAKVYRELGFIAAMRANRLARNAIGHRRHVSSAFVTAMRLAWAKQNCTKFAHPIIAYLMVATRSLDMAASCGPQLDQSCWPPVGMSK
jgi:hypothetical protein